jgi:hypothetical protein
MPYPQTDQPKSGTHHRSGWLSSTSETRVGDTPPIHYRFGRPDIQKYVVSYRFWIFPIRSWYDDDLFSWFTLAGVGLRILTFFVRSRFQPHDNTQLIVFRKYRS